MRSASPAGPPKRAGRLPHALREARRAEILRVAMEEIAQRGYEDTSMTRIAERAGASKETLYAWFGDKPGLIQALIESNADLAVEVPDPAGVGVDSSLAEVRAALYDVARGLLDLLVGRESVALNRAAMGSAQLSDVLRSAGRSRTGDAMTRYLARLHECGIIAAPDAEEAFRLLFGLVIRDSQIQALLGTPAVPRAARTAQADSGVDAFLILTALRGRDPDRPRD